MASIIVKTGEQDGDFYPLGRRTTVIGRAEVLPIQIIDEHVSRKHLQIRYDRISDSYLAIDMNSRHGVFINGSKIAHETFLHDNDSITIGNTTLLFTVKEIPKEESAMHCFKKVGERYCSTLC